MARATIFSALETFLLFPCQAFFRPFCIFRTMACIFALFSGCCIQCFPAYVLLMMILSLLYDIVVAVFEVFVLLSCDPFLSFLDRHWTLDKEMPTLIFHKDWIPHDYDPILFHDAFFLPPNRTMLNGACPLMWRASASSVAATHDLETL